MSAEEKERGNKWPRFLVLILLLLCFALGGIYGTVCYLAQGADPASTLEPGPMYALDPFYVNLAGERGRVVLKAVLTLDLHHGKIEKNMETYDPIVRDEIIAFLRSKTAAELQDQGLYDELKEELRRRLNQILPEDSIDAVYFTEFLISQ
ncbi:MAG TPA: hypothetical protein GX735_06010 [Firmicutes bacterium]|nr:hypothetical protein [Bacillota bacterium]